ncbi:hypothetical protein E2C01_024871 [Portunus trituberculatus]|uniref:RNase H type-1 domain-containing protein n=1 Tax=Portunus trituberculatus TaxID=210409 RepID=A0A5B7EEJ2_PORTR|nr:hypothetical protein [Portunus trituberculatus]
MDGNKDVPPALPHTRFIEHYSIHSEAIHVFTDGSKFDAVLEWLYLLTNRGYRVGFCWVPGHVGVPSSLLTRDPQPYCDDCLVPLMMRHLLVECPSLIELRHLYLYLYLYLYRFRDRNSGRWLNRGEKKQVEGRHAVNKIKAVSMEIAVEDSKICHIAKKSDVKGSVASLHDLFTS